MACPLASRSSSAVRCGRAAHAVVIAAVAGGALSVAETAHEQIGIEVADPRGLVRTGHGRGRPAGIRAPAGRVRGAGDDLDFSGRVPAPAPPGELAAGGARADDDAEPRERLIRVGADRRQSDETP